MGLWREQLRLRKVLSWGEGTYSKGFADHEGPRRGKRRGGKEGAPRLGAGTRGPFLFSQ